MSIFKIIKILLISIYMMPMKVMRRVYWGYRYWTNPEETLKAVLSEFRTFLAVTPSLSKIKSKEAQADTGLSLQPITIDGYMRVISKILRDEECIFLRKKNINAVMNRLKTKKSSYTHICNSASAIEWLMRYWGVTVKIARPRKPERVPRDILNEQDVSLLFDSCKSTRDKALLSICAYGGLRTSEIAKLSAADVEVDGLSLLVKNGKYSRDRRSCINEEAALSVQKWIVEAKKSLMIFFLPKTRVVSGGPSKELKTAVVWLNAFFRMLFVTPWLQICI